MARLSLTINRLLNNVFFVIGNIVNTILSLNPATSAGVAAAEGVVGAVSSLGQGSSTEDTSGAGFADILLPKLPEVDIASLSGNGLLNGGAANNAALLGQTQPASNLSPEVSKLLTQLAQENLNTKDILPSELTSAEIAQATTGNANIADLSESISSAIIDDILEGNPNAALVENPEEKVNEDGLVFGVPVSNGLEVSTGDLVQEIKDNHLESVQSAQNKNLGIKEDGRILGKDNLENMVGKAESNFDKIAQSLTFNNEGDGIDGQVGADGADGFAGNESKQGFENLMLKTDSQTKVAEGNTKFNKDFADNVAERIEQRIESLKFTKSEKGFDVTLEPGSLGKVHIKVDIVDGKSQFIITAEKQDTLDLLQRDAKGFEKIMNENGLKTDSGSLSFNLQAQNGNQQQDNQKDSSSKNVGFNIDEILNGETNNIGSEANYGTNNAYYDRYYQGMLNIMV